MVSRPPRRRLGDLPGNLTLYSSGTVQSGHQSQPLPKYQLLDKHGDGRQSHRARGVVISDYSTPRPMAPRAAAPRETTRATETDLRKTSKKRRARARARPARARDPTDARRRPNASRPPPPQAVVIGVVAALAMWTRPPSGRRSAGSSANTCRRDLWKSKLRWPSCTSSNGRARPRRSPWTRPPSGRRSSGSSAKTRTREP